MWFMVRFLGSVVIGKELRDCAGRTGVDATFGRLGPRPIHRAMGAKVVSRQATVALESARRPPPRFPAIQASGIARRSVNAIFNM